MSQSPENKERPYIQEDPKTRENINPENQKESREKEQVNPSQIALVGDSIGSGISSAIIRKFPDHKNIAQTSARLEKGEKYKPVVKQLEELDPKETPYLIIQGGTNDIVHDEPTKIAESLIRLYEKAKSMGFKKIIVVTIPPHKNEQYKSKVNVVNAQLRIYAQQGKIELFDLNAEYSEIDPSQNNIGSGGVHPTSKGYEIMAELLVQEMQGNLANRPEINTEAKAEYSQEIAENLEQNSEASKALQAKLIKELEEIPAEQKQKDEQALSGAEITDIRFNTALLNGKEENVREEMKRRLAQYTEKQEDGGLRLNYSKFNASGRDHEMNIGLGDIMPPEYKRVLVITNSGEHKFAKRAIASTSRENNRVGYVDESTGSYLPTFTGEKIYVLDPPIIDEKELTEILAKEKDARKTGKGSFAEQNSYGNDYNEKEPMEPNANSANNQSGESNEGTQELPEGTEFTENITLKGRVIKGLNENIKKGKKNWDHSNTEIKDPKTGKILWKYNPSLSEGENIYNFSIVACTKIGMGKYFHIIWGIVGFESGGFNPFCTNSSGATGLGQIKQKYFARDHLDKWKKDNDFIAKSLLENNEASLLNPFINIYATIQKTKASIARFKKEGIDITTMSEKDQIQYLYLMHHDGGKGAMSTLRFLLKAKQLGANIDTKDSMLAFMQSGTPEAKEALSVLAPSTRNRAQEDPSRFLNTWYVSGPIKVAEYALRGERIHRESTSKPEPNNVSPTTTNSAPPPNLTPREQQEALKARSIPKPNFDYQAVYVLGCGVPEQNNLRAVIGAELALKNGASYMTSGGPTTKFRAKGTTEGESAYNYVTSNPEYNRKFEEQNIIGAIEDKSTNTSENFEKLIKYAKNKGLKKILIVTTETGHGTRAGHGAEGARRLKKLYPEVEVSFYTPENPNIDRNVLA